MDLPAIPIPPPLPPPPTTPPELVFLCELPCIHCAYDLRTIPINARCPECGTPAADSLQSIAATRHTDIARVRRGLFLAALAAIAFPLIAIGIAMLSGFGGSSSEAAPIFAGFLISVCGPILAWVGLHGASRPIMPAEPSTPAPRPSARLSPVLRALAGTYCVFSILSFLFVLGMFNSNIREFGAVLTACALALTGITWTGRNTIACRYFADIARRSNGVRTRRLFAFLFWVSACMCAAALLIALIAAGIYIKEKIAPDTLRGFDRSLEVGLTIVYAVVSSVAWLVTLGWFITWPIALSTLNRHLRHTHRIATAHNGRVLGVAPNPDARFFSRGSN